MMPLTFAEPGKTYIIKKISGAGAVSKHLEDIGLAADRPVTVVSSAGGNMIVRVNDTRMALTREMTTKIMI
ncbi:MAG: ferrous iron transport protein A [Clostridiales bacterium]|nr:ferrous iron transport protein A [Clostridiales bacterium]